MIGFLMDMEEFHELAKSIKTRSAQLELAIQTVTHLDEDEHVLLLIKSYVELIRKANSRMEDLLRNEEWRFRKEYD